MKEKSSFQADPSFLEPEELIRRYGAQIRKRAEILFRKLPVGVLIDADDLYQDFCIKIIAEQKKLNLGGAYKVLNDSLIDKRRKFTTIKRGSGQTNASLEGVFASASDWDQANNDLIAEALIGVPRERLLEYLDRFRKNEDELTLVKTGRGNQTARKTLLNKLKMAVYKLAREEQGEMIDQVCDELDQAVARYFENDGADLKQYTFAALTQKVHREVKPWLELRISEFRTDPGVLAEYKQQAMLLRREEPEKALVLGLLLYGYNRKEIIEKTGLNPTRVNRWCKAIRAPTKA